MCCKNLISFFIMVFFLPVLLLPDQVQADAEDEIYQSLLEGKRILKERDFIQEKSPTVYLTFDDGPSSLTEEVLDILMEEEVKATFFVLGQSAEHHQEVLKRIVKEGHAIGNHTYTHNYRKLYRSFSAFWDEIQKTEKLIYDVTGIRTSLVRTPGGTYKNWDSFYFYYMDQADYLIYDWNVDSGDSKHSKVSTEEIIQTIKQSPLKDKLIVLMHDGQGHQNTVKALPEIIKYYKGLGYQFHTLSEKVEPIVHHHVPTKWDREDEYVVHDQFIREIPSVLSADPSGYSVTMKKKNLYKKELLIKQIGIEEASQPIYVTMEQNIQPMISLPAIHTSTLTKIWSQLPLWKTFFTFPFFDL